eukprot:4145442-Prymnesium_polylepis.1
MSGAGASRRRLAARRRRRRRPASAADQYIHMSYLARERRQRAGVSHGGGVPGSGLRHRAHGRRTDKLALARDT